MASNEIRMSLSFVSSERPDSFAGLLKALCPAAHVLDQPGQSAFEMQDVLLEFYGRCCAMPTYLQQPFLINLFVDDMKGAIETALQQGAAMLFSEPDAVDGLRACHVRLTCGLVVGFLPKPEKARIK